MAVTASAAFTHQIDALQGKGRREAGRANAVNIFGIRPADTQRARRHYT